MELSTTKLPLVSICLAAPHPLAAQTICFLAVLFWFFFLRGIWVKRGCPWDRWIREGWFFFGAGREFPLMRGGVGDFGRYKNSAEPFPAPNQPGWYFMAGVGGEGDAAVNLG